MSERGWYRRRPTEIKAIQVPEEAGATIATPAHVHLRYHDGGILAVYNELHGSWIGVKPGDYLRVDQPGDVYPIDRETFEATYDPIPEPSG